MALKKLQFRPGVNKEVTAYTAEGGWVDADKVRFRQGFPEKIGGWQRMMAFAYRGTCRDLIEWARLSGAKRYGVGTNLKYYVSRGSDLTDITPLRLTTAPGAVTFSVVSGSNTLTVAHVAHGALPGDFVTYASALSLGGGITATILNTEHQITRVLSTDAYEVVLAVAATSLDTGSGGTAAVAAYQLNTGRAVVTPPSGFGSSFWGAGPWGLGDPQGRPPRFWSHAGYGEDLIFGPVGGALYYYDSSSVGLLTTPRGELISGGDVPLLHNSLLVSDVSRFVIVFGCNELGETEIDPMLVRWSEQEDYTVWTPSITNQAGGQRLSAGNKIVTAKQSRQEVLIWTDSALYGMQYQGPPVVWGFQLLGENISIVSRSCVAVVNNTVFWMGNDKFYRYDGRVQTLRCDVRRHVFSNLNKTQQELIFCGTNEGFNEVWWFYPATGSDNPNKYVVYNYEEDIWYNGTLSRTAWLDSRLRGNPIAAGASHLLDHEVGVDDADGIGPSPLLAYIESAPADIDDGDRFAFVWRVLPDVTFEGSVATAPRVQMTLLPRKNAGRGRNSPLSVGGAAQQDVARSVSVPVEQYTEQVGIRVRGRQIALRIDSSALGVAWQLGSPQVDMKPDGRAG